MIRPMPRLREIAWILLVSLVSATAARAGDTVPTFEDARRLLAQAESATETCGNCCAHRATSAVRAHSRDKWRGELRNFTIGRDEQIG